MRIINKEYELVEKEQDEKLVQREKLFMRSKKAARKMTEYREKIDCLKNERWRDTIGVNLEEGDL